MWSEKRAEPLLFAFQGSGVVEKEEGISKEVGGANRIGKEQVKLVLALVIGLRAVKHAHTGSRCGKRGVVYDMQDVVAAGANEGLFAFTAQRWANG